MVVRQQHLQVPSPEQVPKPKKKIKDLGKYSSRGNPKGAHCMIVLARSTEKAHWSETANMIAVIACKIDREYTLLKPQQQVLTHQAGDITSKDPSRYTQYYLKSLSYYPTIWNFAAEPASVYCFSQISRDQEQLQSHAYPESNRIDPDHDGSCQPTVAMALLT